LGREVALQQLKQHFRKSSIGTATQLHVPPLATVAVAAAAASAAAAAAAAKQWIGVSLRLLQWFCARPLQIAALVRIKLNIFQFSLRNSFEFTGLELPQMRTDAHRTQRVFSAFRC
jgi:hypothetical protein